MLIDTADLSCAIACVLMVPREMKALQECEDCHHVSDLYVAIAAAAAVLQCIMN